MVEGMQYLVVSRSEVVRGWGKAAATVERAFWAGKLRGRRIDDRGTLIFLYADVVALWGQPKSIPFAGGDVQ